MLDAFLVAEYEDGFCLVEDEEDRSPYDEGRNIFHAILNERPVDEHGRLMNLSLTTRLDTYTIDWAALPDNARPVRFKHMELDLFPEPGVPRLMSIDFGYQYLDDEGHNVQSIQQVVI